MDEAHARDAAGSTRRQLLKLGGATAGAAWVAPAVLRVDRASASPGSCTDLTVAWNSVTGSNPWTATGVSSGVTITATVRARTSGTPSVYLNSGNVIMSVGSGHAIGDRFDVRLSFTHATGTICSATSRILDVDQNGRGLGCPTNSRFRDEITSLGGIGLSLSTEGALAEVTPGVYASTANCKTTDQENLVMTWARSTGVSSGRFRWRMGTPPGSDTTLDFQLIKLTPFTVCATGSGAAVRGPGRATTGTVAAD